MKQKEIIKQHDLKDCGVCCLLSIIKHYGGFIPLEKLRIDTHTSLEGTTAYHLIDAAKKYGLDSYGMKLNNVKELREILLPAIAHVEINHLLHFVTIYKINKNKIELMDPAKGKVKMNLSDFEKIWTGNVIISHPIYSLPKTNPNNFFKDFFVRCLKSEKNNIFAIITTSIIFTLITIVTSFYLKVGVNFISEFSEIRILYSISILFLILSLTKTLIYYLKNNFKTKLNKNIDGLLYYSFIHRLFSLPNYFIKNRTTGEIMLRLTELSNFKMFFSEIITTISIDSILACGIGYLLFKMNSKLFFILCLFAFIYIIYGIICGKILYKNVLESNEKEAEFQSLTVENLDTIITLKNLNVLEKAIKKLEIILFKFLNKKLNLNKSIINVSVISFLLEELLQFLIITIGLIEIVEQRLTLVDFVTFESLLNYFIEPFRNIIQLIPDYNCIKISLEKINDFYALDLTDDQKGLKEFRAGDIVLGKVSLSHNQLYNLFVNINKKILTNRLVLIKGPSGSGKSTLCQIISRLIDAKNSDIKINGVNINDYSLETIRKNIIYVGQKEFLIQETIRNNICLYRDIDEEEFNKITRICHIEEIVSKKPLRYETFLMKDSLNLSGGEKQRIILARALLSKSKILILDEALSEVNEDLEIEIINDLKKYFNDKTIIYVSHKQHDKYFDDVIDLGALNERRV